ncbi:MAG: hypothetical protein V3T77_10625 [Planctomycetota bacterium]
MVNSRAELEQLLEGKENQPLLLLYGALAMGTLIFASIVIALYLQGGSSEKPPASDQVNLIRLLSLIHGALLLATLTSSWILFQARMARLPLQEAGRKLTEYIHNTWLIRAALLEGTALFGLVICLLAGQGGVLSASPIYWVNLLSSVLFLLFLAATLPTRARLLAILEDRLSSMHN